MIIFLGLLPLILTLILGISISVNRPKRRMLRVINGQRR